MSEEGIAKGVRRIVAVTAAEATAAIAEGERLMGEVQAVSKLSGEQQDKAVSTLKQVRSRPVGLRIQHSCTAGSAQNILYAARGHNVQLSTLH